MDCTITHLSPMEVVAVDTAPEIATVVDGLASNLTDAGSIVVQRSDDLSSVSPMTHVSHSGINTLTQSVMNLEVDVIQNTSPEPISPTCTNCILSLPATGTTQAIMVISPVKRLTPFKPNISSSKKSPLPSISTSQPSK